MRKWAVSVTERRGESDTAHVESPAPFLAQSLGAFIVFLSDQWSDTYKRFPITAFKNVFLFSEK